MGGFNSTPYAGELKTEWLEVFYAMKLTRPEVVKMYEIFKDIDRDGSGSIDVVELLTLMDIDRTDFTERIFTAFDKDHTGKIHFYEFVVSLWKFCTLGNGAIAVFAFDIYDTDADGILSAKEAMKMYNELAGSNPKDDSTKSALLQISNTEHNTVLIDDFRPFCRTHQALLFPVFTAQDKLRTHAMGCLFWDEVSRRRIQLRPGYNVPISELMVLHSDRSLFRSLLEDQTIMSISKMMKKVLENTDNAIHYVETKERRRSMTDRIRDKLISVGNSFKGGRGGNKRHGTLGLTPMAPAHAKSGHHIKKVAPSPRSSHTTHTSSTNGSSVTSPRGVDQLNQKVYVN